jgi:predicted Zn-dependent protease
MFRKLVLTTVSLGLCLAIGCASPKPVKVLTISEQIEVDTQKAKNFINEFQKQATFVSFPEGERYLNQLAARLAKIETGFTYEAVRVRIHDDSNPQLSRPFAFPGTTISIPLSLLKNIAYENELAAVFAFELANVMNRHLAKKMDQTQNAELFGENSVFGLDRNQRQESILLGTRLLYYAGYDPRGMASIFQRYPTDFSNGSLDKKEVEFNVREAQKAKSEYLPSRDPIVRSAEFIKMKKGLKRL